MEQYIIKGGNPLVGEVEIGGAKNAALAILAAAIMTDETVQIDNLPEQSLITLNRDSLPTRQGSPDLSHQRRHRHCRHQAAC